MNCVNFVGDWSFVCQICVKPIFSMDTLRMDLYSVVAYCLKILIGFLVGLGALLILGSI